LRIKVAKRLQRLKRYKHNTFKNANKNPDIAPLVKHFIHRAEQRFELNLNRQARIELNNIASSSSNRIIAKQPYGSSKKEVRQIIILPLYKSKTTVELNPDIKFGDNVIVVFDKKLQKIVAILKQHKVGNIVYKSTYKADNNPVEDK